MELQKEQRWTITIRFGTLNEKGGKLPIYLSAVSIVATAFAIGKVFDVSKKNYIQNKIEYLHTLIVSEELKLGTSNLSDRNTSTPSSFVPTSSSASQLIFMELQTH